jgi:hypothetical protein
MLAVVAAISASGLLAQFRSIEVDVHQLGQFDIRFRLPVLGDLSHKVVTYALRFVGRILARFDDLGEVQLLFGQHVDAGVHPYAE